MKKIGSLPSRYFLIDWADEHELGTFWRLVIYLGLLVVTALVVVFYLILTALIVWGAVALLNHLSSWPSGSS